MKTLTEFAAITLKNAAKTKQELVASGKTPEELPQAMGEALKLEGDKLNYLLHAVELTETRQEDLKRVVVFSLGEGEKAPSGAQQKGEQYYAAEYYPPLSGKGGKPKRGEGHPGKGGKDRDKKKRRGRRGRPEDRRGPQAGDRDRGPRPPRKEQTRIIAPKSAPAPVPAPSPESPPAPAPENSKS